MKRTKRLTLLVLAGCCAGAIAAGSAAAALPEIGRCVKLTPTLEGHKKIYAGKFVNKNCTKETKSNQAGKGKYEWLPGASETGKSVESPGTREPVTLETAGGRQIHCTNSKSFGQYTGANTETMELSLYGCEDSLTHEPCQSIRPEEVPPNPQEGTIISMALTGELGFIAGKGAKPHVGWDYKPASGSKLFEFECGKTFGAGTKVSIEGSFISQVKQFIDRMTEEYFLTDRQKAGLQEPESFIGGEKDTLTATFVSPSLEMKTEALGWEAAEEEQATNEPLEIKAIA